MARIRDLTQADLDAVLGRPIDIASKADTMYRYSLHYNAVDQVFELTRLDKSSRAIVLLGTYPTGAPAIVAYNNIVI